jgi:hypothetical protein
VLSTYSDGQEAYVERFALDKIVELTDDLGDIRDMGGNGVPILVTEEPPVLSTVAIICWS